MLSIELTSEQQELLNQVSLGKNVLVDACIGSGKTTAIQVLCDTFQSKRILYLTYNKLLKIDAKNKIQSNNTKVTNYHGLAWETLTKMKVKAGISDLIQTFNKEKPRVPHYDMLVLDEYQDIDLEISKLLKRIKECNPNIQIVAVGDMKQKIYDKTTLDVLDFMDEFMEEYEILHFTYCFRLCPALARKLGRIWGKKIVGVNENCKVESKNLKEITEFLAKQNPADILCLGARTGAMSWVLNNLEEDYSEKFNKKTVFASIKDEGGGATQPSEKTAIFTTYDSSKGLERKICVIFDYTEEYWTLRTGMPQTKYEIMRNIFCVAASRGKERIIFVRNGSEKGKTKETPLTEKMLSTPTEENMIFNDFDISDMFDFKYKEDVEECFQELEIKEIPLTDKTVIDIKNSDELIDLSPCIGTYQETVFFKGYDIDKEIAYTIKLHPDRPPLNYDTNGHLEDKILLLTAFETYQDRYVKQVEKPIVSNEQKSMLKKRLSTVFTPFESVQILGSMCVRNKKKEPLFFIDGKCDVLTNDAVYELKFVYELKHEHYLQLACYMVALDMEKGILWNTKKNEMYEISIPDKAVFMKKVVKAITKGKVEGCIVELNAKTRSEREMEKFAKFSEKE